MRIYRHTQAGHVIFLALLAAAGLSALILLLSGARAFVVLTTGVALVLSILFSSLTVTIDREHLALRFGPGPIGRRWRLDEIAAARAVRNPWYTGWGVRMLPGATVYNIAGFDAVEIELTNGKRYRIGTDEPARLLEAVEAGTSTSAEGVGAR